MTTDDATRLMAALTAAFPKADPPAASIESYYDHLLPLPIDQAQAGINRLIAGVDRAEKAQPFFPSIPEMLGAIGLNDEARRELARIKPDHLNKTPATGQMLPSLRSMSGWEAVGECAPIPDGVALYYREARKPLPPGVVAPLVLQAARAGESRADVDTPRPFTILADISRDLAERRDANTRRTIAERNAPPPLALVERDDLPPKLQRALEATAQERDKLEQARRRIDAQEAYVEELRHELERRLRDGTVDSVTAQKVVTALVAQLAADPLYGLDAIGEALRDALIPGGTVRVLGVDAPRLDDFDEEAPLVEVKIDIRAKPTAPDVRPERAKPCPTCPDCGGERRWLSFGTGPGNRTPSCPKCGSTRVKRSD